MAEIRIEKKNRSPWLWIVGLLVVALLAWFLIDSFNDGGEILSEGEEIEAIDGDGVIEGDMNDAAAYDMANSSEYESYMNFVSRAKGNMSVYHEYSSEGIKELAGALSAMVQEYGLTNDVNIENKRQTMMTAANSITEDWQETTHADQIKKAFMAAADLMNSIQEEAYPDLNNSVNEAEQAAQAIDPSILTMNQTEQVKSFFDESAQVLEDMANRRPSLSSAEYGLNQ